jgi:hypothetical protein
MEGIKYYWYNANESVQYAAIDEMLPLHTITDVKISSEELKVTSGKLALIFNLIKINFLSF